MEFNEITVTVLPIYKTVGRSNCYEHSQVGWRSRLRLRRTEPGIRFAILRKAFHSAPSKDVGCQMVRHTATLSMLLLLLFFFHFFSDLYPLKPRDFTRQAKQAHKKANEHQQEISCMTTEGK